MLLKETFIGVFNHMIHRAIHGKQVIINNTFEMHSKYPKRGFLFFTRDTINSSRCTQMWNYYTPSATCTLCHIKTGNYSCFYLSKNPTFKCPNLNFLLRCLIPRNTKADEKMNTGVHSVDDYKDFKIIIAQN